MGIFGEASVVSIAGFILTVVSFVIHLIGFASPFWSYVTTIDRKVNIGLWQACTKANELKICVSLSCDGAAVEQQWCSSTWKAVQALEILGLLAVFAAVVLISLKMFKFNDKTILKLAGICCCFIGGVFILIGVIVYGTQENIEKTSFHFAFAFCIVAAIGSVIAAILLFIGDRLSK